MWSPRRGEVRQCCPTRGGEKRAHPREMRYCFTIQLSRRFSDSERAASPEEAAAFLTSAWLVSEEGVSGGPLDLSNEI